MNTLDYYYRQKEGWTEKEAQDIRDEYAVKELTISQIADIHHRTPGSISYKLKSMGMITHTTLSRGYTEYKNSSLYKEIVEAGKAKDTEKKEKKEAKLKQKTEIHVIHSSTEMADLRKEVENLKNDVKEILRIMNSLYDRKSQ